MDSKRAGQVRGPGIRGNASRDIGVTPATHGVLFLDEFVAPVIDGLRQPLEEGVVRVSRARASVTFPAKVLLVAAMNPCPCGEGGPPGACPCNEAVRHRGDLVPGVELARRCVARGAVEGSFDRASSWSPRQGSRLFVGHDPPPRRF